MRHKFKPFAHGRFNFGCIHSGAVHAPCGTTDGKGGIYLITNINDAQPTEGWNHLMSLVRLLTLREDNTLGIEPVYAVQTPRSEHTQVSETPLPANLDVVLESIQGNAMELAVEIDPRSARAICLSVLRSPNREETTAIKIFQGAYFRTTKENGKRDADALVLDTSRSSLAHDVSGRPRKSRRLCSRGGNRSGFGYSWTGASSTSSPTVFNVSPCGSTPIAKTAWVWPSVPGAETRSCARSMRGR